MDQKTYRLSKRMTLTAFADRLGVSAATVWRYEHGRVPSPPLMRRIIEEFGGEIIPCDYFADLNHEGSVNV